MPPSDKLYKFGGEIYVGYEDGSSAYFDQYGRTRPEWELLRKKKIKGKIGANAPCPCGSGKKYKKCCRGKSELDQMIKDADNPVSVQMMLF